MFVVPIGRLTCNHGLCFDCIYQIRNNELGKRIVRCPMCRFQNSKVTVLVVNERNYYTMEIFVNKIKRNVTPINGLKNFVGGLMSTIVTTPATHVHSNNITTNVNASNPNLNYDSSSFDYLPAVTFPSSTRSQPTFSTSATRPSTSATRPSTSAAGPSTSTTRPLTSAVTPAMFTELPASTLMKYILQHKSLTIKILMHAYIKKRFGNVTSESWPGIKWSFAAHMAYVCQEVYEQFAMDKSLIEIDFIIVAKDDDHIEHRNIATMVDDYTCVQDVINENFVDTLDTDEPRLPLVTPIVVPSTFIDDSTYTCAPSTSTCAVSTLTATPIIEPVVSTSKAIPNSSSSSNFSNTAPDNIVNKLENKIKKLREELDNMKTANLLLQVEKQSLQQNVSDLQQIQVALMVPDTADINSGNDVNVARQIKNKKRKINRRKYVPILVSDDSDFSD